MSSAVLTEKQMTRELLRNSTQKLWVTMRAVFQQEFCPQLVTYWFGSLDAKVNLVSFHHMYNCKKIVTVCCSGLKSTTSYTVIDWFIYIGGLEGNVLSYGTSIWHNLSPIWFSSHGLTIDWPLQWSIKTKHHNKIYSKNGDDEKADGIRSFQESHMEKQMALAIIATNEKWQL